MFNSLSYAVNGTVHERGNVVGNDNGDVRRHVNANGHGNRDVHGNENANEYVSVNRNVNVLMEVDMTTILHMQL